MTTHTHKRTIPAITKGFDIIDDSWDDDDDALFSVINGTFCCSVDKGSSKVVGSGTKSDGSDVGGGETVFGIVGKGTKTVGSGIGCDGIIAVESDGNGELFGKDMHE